MSARRGRPTAARAGGGPQEGCSGSARALRAPWPAEVIVSPAGVPHALVEAGRRRAVIAVREDWLVQDRWWTDQPVDRHYFELVLEPGRAALVYRDLRSGRWLVHR